MLIMAVTTTAAITVHSVGSVMIIVVVVVVAVAVIVVVLEQRPILRHGCMWGVVLSTVLVRP